VELRARVLEPHQKGVIGWAGGGEELEEFSSFGKLW
tara:strand:- start:400 stop:507 length:108 start_codon:yes stop_codon:yes gene_type:complete